MKYQTFIHRALHNQCRECINQIYGLTLQPKDCQYWYYQGRCNNCGRTRHIVTGIEPLSRWKIWLKR